MSEKVVIDLKIVLPRVYLYTIHSGIQKILDLIRGTVPENDFQFTYIVDGSIAKDIN